MTEKVMIFGELVEVKICENCKGSGYSQEWSRELQKHIKDKNYCCEICKGGRFIVLPKKPQ